MNSSKYDEAEFSNTQSKNEFMTANFNQSHHPMPSENQRKPPEQFQKIMNFMEKMMNNPQLMNSFMSQKMMEQSRISQQNHKESFYYEQPPQKNPQPPRGKTERRKGQDVLKKKKTENEHPNKMNNQKNFISEDANIIKSSVREESSKQSKVSNYQSNPYDEIPIKSNYIQMQSQMAVEDPAESELNKNLAKMNEERPIQGISGNFKEHIKNLPGINDIPEEYHEEQPVQQYESNNSKAVEAKPFLKRGSRQYLSSAKERSTVKRKKTTKQVQNLDKSSDKIEVTKNRSVSQNRLLNKKRNTERSTNKVEEKIEKFTQEKSPRVSKITKKDQPPKPTQSPTFKQFEVPPSPSIKKKKTAKTNVFEDESSSQNEDEDFTRKRSLRELPKQEVIPGVFITKGQLTEILQKHSKVRNFPQKSQDEEKIKQLKNKYIDLCNVAAQQRRYFEKQMEKQREILSKEKEEFQAFKNSELTKIKNERKMQERQLANRQTMNHNVQKEKEELDMMRKEIEREKEQFKKKDKNNRIIVDKYKKELEELRMKMKLFSDQKKQEVICSVCSSKQGEKKESYQRKTTTRNKQVEKQKEDDYFEVQNKRNKQTFDDKIKNKKTAAKQFEEENPFQKQTKQKFSYKQNPFQKKIISSSQSEGEYEESENSQNQEEIVQYTPQMKLNDLTKIPLSMKMVTDEMIMDMFRYQNNPEYLEYLNITRGHREKISTTRNTIEKKLTNIYKDGGKELIFQTGVRKEYFQNGYSIIFFNNGDIKQKLVDGTVLYYYRERQVDQITLTNNVNIYRFENNQVEFHYDDKRIEIRHPDGSLKVI